jgi:hypothetical protein
MKFLAAILFSATLLLVGCATPPTTIPPEPAVIEPTSTPATATLPAPTPTQASTATETIMPPEAEQETPMTGQANADVLFVRATQAGDGTWTFAVTVEHPDSGWKDYADGWDVVLPDGTVSKPDPDSPFTRLLLHPHENEQPFTRSQGGIVIPAEVTQVTVRAHDLVDGFGGQAVNVDLTQAAGENYEVQSNP